MRRLEVKVKRPNLINNVHMEHTPSSHSASLEQDTSPKALIQ